MNYFVHDRGICESKNIGKGTRIWAFSHVLPGAKIGSDCNICDNVFVENDVILGDRVTVKCGVQIWDGIRIEDDAFIGPNVTFSNDLYPRSKVQRASNAETLVAKGASIGANSTILPNVKIGRLALVGAGSVVTRDVPPFAIVRGNPARIVGYVDSKTSVDVAVSTPRRGGAAAASTYESSVSGAVLHHLHHVEDMRGDLAVGELEKEVPFDVKRFFIVYNVPSEHIRGEHAHRQAKQFLIAVNGSLKVMLDDGEHREEFSLSSPTTGLYVPRMIWASQFQYSEDATLLVFASELYDASDYIRDYDEFLAALEKR